ncbi:hypothetical protein GCM10011408_36100 [Dyella caseinilytica]|nr:hypothetical protein GCM10011408_36100 [Dyella caseinilytica]
MQANGLLWAGIDAGHAKNVVLGETLFADGYLQMPWCLITGINSTRGAGARAVAAEGAFATGEIDDWKATVADDDDVSGAGSYAVVAARAAIKEILFGQRPRRPYRCCRSTAAKQEGAACLEVVHGSMSHRTGWSVEHLPDPHCESPGANKKNRDDRSEYHGQEYEYPGFPATTVVDGYLIHAPLPTQSAFSIRAKVRMNSADGQIWPSRRLHIGITF